MKYSEDFINRVIQVLGDSEDVRKALAWGFNGAPTLSNNMLVGRYLDEARMTNPEAGKLYEEWLDMYKNFYGIGETSKKVR